MSTTNSGIYLDLPTWRELHQDTSVEAEEVMFRLLRSLSSERKFQLLVAHNQSVLEIAEGGIRQQFPTASQNEIRYHLALRLWGEEVATNYYANAK